MRALLVFLILMTHWTLGFAAGAIYGRDLLASWRARRAARYLFDNYGPDVGQEGARGHERRS